MGVVSIASANQRASRAFSRSPRQLGGVTGHLRQGAEHPRRDRSLSIIMYHIDQAPADP